MSTRSADRRHAAPRAVALSGLVALVALLAPSLVRAQGYPRIFDFGAPASTADIAAVAIAIAPDGKGLPAGKGDYVAGKKVYESTCIACHGDKLQGVAGLKDMPAGAALRLIGGRSMLLTTDPVMTVESYWPYAATPFDHVRPAMSVLAPGSPIAHHVYSVCAYSLA